VPNGTSMKRFKINENCYSAATSAGGR
jgi:hypothetical protein